MSLRSSVLMRGQIPQVIGVGFFSSKINRCILSASGQDKTFQICPNLVFTWDIFCVFDFEIKFKSALDQLYCPYDHALPHTGFLFSYYRVYTCSITSLHLLFLDRSWWWWQSITVPMLCLYWLSHSQHCRTTKWSSVWQCFTSEYLASSTSII